MANAGYSQLPRALWGKGMEEMVLHLDLHPGIAKNPVHEDMFLTCFYQLRGINEVILKGVRGEKHKTKMARELTMPYLDSNDILQDIGQAKFIYDQYIKDGGPQGAAELLECSIAVLADCVRVCGSDFLAADAKIFRQICRTTFKLASMLVHARLKPGRFNSAIKYA